jgi:hypothetical protein
MRVLFAMVLVPGLVFATGGCDGPKNTQYDGPKVDTFTGRLTHDGKPVSFPDGDYVQLKVFHEKGTSMGIRIRSDGTFTIGWMLIGKYSAILETPPKGGKGAPSKHNIPGGFTIEEGRTDYTIELGKDWRP